MSARDIFNFVSARPGTKRETPKQRGQRMRGAPWFDSMHYTQRAWKVLAHRSAEDCVGMGEADSQLTGLPRHNFF